MFGHETPFFDTLGFVVYVCLSSLSQCRAPDIIVNEEKTELNLIANLHWRKEMYSWFEKWLDPEDYLRSVACTGRCQGKEVTHELKLSLDELEGTCYHYGSKNYALQNCRLNQYCIRKKVSANEYKPVCTARPIDREPFTCNKTVFVPGLCKLMEPQCWTDSSCVSHVTLSAYQDPDQVLPLGTYIKWPVTDSVRFSYYANQAEGKNVYVSLTCLERGKGRGSTSFEYEVKTFKADATSVASGDVTFRICFDSELFRIGISTDEGDSFYLYGVPFVFDVELEPEEKKLLETSPDNRVAKVKCKIDTPFAITDLFHVQTWWSLSSTGKDLKTDILNGDEHVSSNYRCNVLVKFQSTFPRIELEEYKHREMRIYLSGLRNVDFNSTISMQKYSKRRPVKEEDILSKDVLLAVIIASSAVFGLGFLCFIEWYARAVGGTKVRLGRLKRKPRSRRKRVKASVGRTSESFASQRRKSGEDEDEASEPLLQHEEEEEESIRIEIEGSEVDKSDSMETEGETSTEDTRDQADEEEEESTESKKTEEPEDKEDEDEEDKTESTEKSAEKEEEEDEKTESSEQKTREEAETPAVEEEKDNSEATESKQANSEEE